MVILISTVLNPFCAMGQHFPGGGYQGGKYGHGGIENISGIPDVTYEAGGNCLTAHPNPFSKLSTILFTASVPGNIEIYVFDINNRRIKTLISPSNMPPGTYTVTWDGTDDRGNRVAPGVYLYKMTKSKTTITKKILFTGN